MSKNLGRFHFFNLMELIIVISIIAILLSMLLPHLGEAREKARSALCKNNLKNIGIAAQSYSFEYGYVMPASFGETDDGYYNHFINYIISTQDFPGESFQCPSMKRSSMFDPDGHDPLVGNVNKQASYIMNIVGNGKWSGADIDGKGTANGWGLNSVTPISLSEVVSPSSKIHIMDAAENIANTHSGVNKFARTDHGVYKEKPTGDARWVGIFHSGGFNAVYGDGHVVWQTKTKDTAWAVNR